ncbi:restriction endonuclease subunit S [Bacteroides sp. RTP21281st1_E4_RTP21281_210402]|uniref:restriction endonuclease subunit S n=1 Tax=unclassified Bacteroides TaxID=2646097 RepID=UPI0034A2B3C8
MIYNEYGNNIIEYIGHYTQLPDRWTIATLKDLCENINGLWKGKKEPFVNVGVIRNANFTKDFKLDYTNIEFIDVEQRTFAKRHLINGDLIVEKSGGSDNNPVGRTILYEGESGVFSFSNFTMVLRIRYNDTVLSKYLYYYILAKYQTGAMRLMQTQTTGLHNLILDKFLLMPICLPPLYEQKRIIDRIETIFTTLDAIMESL